MKSEPQSPMNWSVWIGGAAALIAGVLAIAWYLNRSDFDDGSVAAPLPVVRASGNPANVAHQRPAPLFELPTSDGRPFKLESMKGNAVVVHFWASWCPPCLDEIPKWMDFANRWSGKPVRFVAVSLDKAWPEAEKILSSSKLPAGSVSVLDRDQTLPDLFGTYQYPETYLLGPDLRIVSKWVGAQDWDSPAIRQAIEALLSQR